MVATASRAVAYAFAAVAVGIIMGAVPLPESLYRPIMKWGIAKFEGNTIPDFLSRAGVQLMIGKTLQKHETFDGPPGSERHREYVRGFILDLKQRSIAEQTKEANVQHYEVR